MNRTLKNFSYVAIGRVITSALLSVFYLLIATILEPSDLGQISYLMAIAGTASVISRFGFPLSVIVYHGKQKHDLSNQLNLLALISSGVASLILLSIDVYAALLCFALTSFLMNTGNLLGLKKYKKFVWASFVRSVSIITIPILLYFLWDIPGIIIGLAIGNFLGSTDMFKSLSLKIHSFRETRAVRKVLTHNFALEASSALTRWVDKLLIVPLYGFAFAGLYQFNLQILFILTILPNSLYTFLLTEKSNGSVPRYLSYLTISGSIILVIVGIIFSPFLIDQLFPKYQEGIFSLQILIITLIPITFSAIMGADLQSKESTKVGYPVILKIVSLLVFLIIFGELYGLPGLSISFLLATTLETIFFLFLYLKSKKIKEMN